VHADDAAFHQNTLATCLVSVPGTVRNVQVADEWECVPQHGLQVCEVTVQGH